MADAKIAPDTAPGLAASAKVKPACSCSRMVARGGRSASGAHRRCQPQSHSVPPRMHPLRPATAWSAGPAPPPPVRVLDPPSRANSVAPPARANPRAGSRQAATRAGDEAPAPHPPRPRLLRAVAPGCHAGLRDEALPQRRAIALALGRRIRSAGAWPEPAACRPRVDVGAMPPAGDRRQVVRRGHRQRRRIPGFGGGEAVVVPRSNHRTRMPCTPSWFSVSRNPAGTVPRSSPTTMAWCRADSSASSRSRSVSG